MSSEIKNTAAELIEYIGAIENTYEVKFGSIENSSRIYDIRDFFKVEIPDDIIAVYVRKSRVDAIPVRFVIGGVELKLFKEFIDTTRVKKFVSIPETNRDIIIVAWKEKADNGDRSEGVYDTWFPTKERAILEIIKDIEENTPLFSESPTKPENIRNMLEYGNVSTSMWNGITYIYEIHTIKKYEGD